VFKLSQSQSKAQVPDHFYSCRRRHSDTLGAYDYKIDIISILNAYLNEYESVANQCKDHITINQTRIFAFETQIQELYCI
jgi:hypothetical protein